MDYETNERPDDHLLTATQIFDYCGVESTGSLRVSVLMDKFAPFVNTNKTDFSCFKSLLDPGATNPEINVSELAKTLNKFSENQKTKLDLDERASQALQDSDSGISSDGCQSLEEIQCELREKVHLVHKLQNQLDFSDRQHDEALVTLAAERDSLKTQLNMLREEIITVTRMRNDYEETCEKLSGTEQVLQKTMRELDNMKKKSKVRQEQIGHLENEKLTLQELLNKSKDECHRINEMYASRQSSLLVENETLKTEHADLTSRLQDQDEFMRQLIKEKLILEMELKDLFNKSNQTRLDQLVDVSYTDEQMAAALNGRNNPFPDYASISTQAEIPCLDCAKRNLPCSGLRKYLWEPLQRLFQVFAVVCFICAVWLLYGVMSSRRRDCRAEVPWRWLHAQDLLDLLLRIEYVADVPM